MSARPVSATDLTKHRDLTAQSQRKLFLQAFSLVERDYRHPLTLARIARLLCSSPRQIQRAYEEVGHTTFSRHLTAARLANAAELLATQPLRVSDVARMVGYRQPGQFSRAFTRRYGMAPTDYRDGAATMPARNQEGRRVPAPGRSARIPAGSREIRPTTVPAAHNADPRPKRTQSTCS